jgi:hypothetical protein
MFRKSLVLVAIIGIATVLAAASTNTVSRVFKLEHVSVLEVSAAVQPLLSDVGSMTLQPKLSKIVVQDQPEVIDRVTKLIKTLDHLPGLYSVEIELLEGTEPKPFGTRDEIKAEDRLRKMFNVAAFHRLGSSMVEGQLGDRAQADLGTDFRVSFLPQLPEPPESTPWGAPTPGNRIYLRPLVLERMVTSSDGELTTHELLRTNAVLSQKQTVYIGAGNSEDSGHVLVLVVHVTETGSR